MAKITIKHNRGFTLVELLAAVAIVGVIATLALPRYRPMLARARAAEAKTNLAVLNSLQKEYRYIDYAEDPTPYKDKATGYHKGLHYGLDKCSDSATESRNDLGFRLSDCSRSRYRYITNLGNDCAKSDGSIAQGQVYPNCNADDVWSINVGAQLKHVKRVIDQCPDGAGSAPSSCTAVVVPLPPPVVFVTTPTTPPGGTPITPPCVNSCAAGCTAWASGSWSSWSPARLTQCKGTNFMQGRSRAKSRSCSNLCAGVTCVTADSENDTPRSKTGLKDCTTTPPPACKNSCAAACSSWTVAGSWGNWQPDPSSVCSNSQVMQTRKRPLTRSCANLCSGVSCAVNDDEYAPLKAVAGTLSCDPTTPTLTITPPDAPDNPDTPDAPDNPDAPDAPDTQAPPTVNNNGGGGATKCCIFQGTSKEVCVTVDALSKNTCKRVKDNMEILYGVDVKSPPDDTMKLLHTANIFSKNIQNNQERYQDLGGDKEGNEKRTKTSEIEQRETYALERALEILEYRENNKDKKDFKVTYEFDDLDDLKKKILKNDQEYQRMIGNDDDDKEWPKCEACKEASGGNGWQKCLSKGGNSWTRACLLSVEQRGSSCEDVIQGCHRVGNVCRRCDDTSGVVKYNVCTCPSTPYVEQVEVLPDGEKQEEQTENKQDKLSGKYPRCGVCARKVNKCWQTCEYRNHETKTVQCTCPPDPTTETCSSYSCFKHPTNGLCFKCYINNGKKKYSQCACSSVGGNSPAPKPKSCTPRCGSCSGGKKSCTSKACKSYTKTCSSPAPAPKSKSCTPRCGSCSGGKKSCTSKACKSYTKTCSSSPAPAPKASETCRSSSCFRNSSSGKCMRCYISNGKKKYSSCSCPSSSPAPAPAPKPKSCTPRCGSCSRGKKSCTSKTCRSYTKTCSTSSPAPAPKPKSCTPRCGSCSRGKKSCTSKTCRSYTKTCSTSSPAPAPKASETCRSSSCFRNSSSGKCMRCYISNGKKKYSSCSCP